MKFQAVETDQYTEVGEEFEAEDMCEALNILLSEHGITVREVEEDENRLITALQHNISYWLDDDSIMESGDCEHEHIEYMIGQGFAEGELCKTIDDAPGGSVKGYWKIVKG